MRKTPPFLKGTVQKECIGGNGDVKGTRNFVGVIDSSLKSYVLLETGTLYLIPNLISLSTDMSTDLTLLTIRRKPDRRRVKIRKG